MDNIVSMNQYNLTQIREIRPKGIFCRWWYKLLLRFRDRIIFLDINPALFWPVLDHLNKQNITSPDITPEDPCVVNDAFIYLWQLILCLY